MTTTAADMLARLAEARSIAAAAGRDDLVERLDHASSALGAGAETAVAVVGEFKQGKSTLVNALLRTDLCPVDADIVTALPTILRFGRPPSAALTGENDDRTPIELGEVQKHITGEAGQEARAVEIRIDRRLLGAGLAIVDTPGVGGLDSAQGNLTLATLTMAGAALFVTDAAQELTAPEVDFLRRTVERCPRTVVVLTKTDLHVEWRRIVEIDQGHLRRAGLDLPVVPVSSFLRMRAQARDDTDLNAESGFPRLVELLRTEIAGSAAEARVTAARAELTFVAAQLRERLDAEEAAAGDPGLHARYAERARRSESLAGGTWQVVLQDGIQDLAADVDHDLRERLRLLIRQGEEILASSDPRETLQDFQAWAAREAARAAADNLMLLVTRAEQLAGEVAERFGMEARDISATLPVLRTNTDKARQITLTFDKSGMRQFLGAFTAARVAYGGFYLLGAVGALFSVAWAAPLGLLAGVTLGRRLVKAEKERQVQQRRAQAGQELRRYVDEVGFHVGRDSREAVRRTQRLLRDEFATRARELSRSAHAAEAVVREVAALAEPQRRHRATSLREQRLRLDRLAS
ncbi:dynamin family protein [Actinoplanes sp. LDG1-06]|uniref:Dynamin family protein n=1 Tax=Paractinoplanes ovalisporus TaxID=2810368 RepID=A0ABS2ABF5_9ACTN|nr:dynamin family protein [Actinoplanes ovalisporus]MBM2616611.1 dynamin family protein [Actinoplanes ovalisporus]